MDSLPNRETGEIPSKNPLQLFPVIRRVMEFLPFKEIQKCRMVCQQWNSIAEDLIENRGIIVFSERFRPSEFLEYFSRRHFADKIFKAFAFRSGGPLVYSIYELHELFLKFGANVRCLRMHYIKVSINENEIIQKLNINPLVELIGTNLEELSILVLSQSTNFEISLNKLPNIKNIRLENCGLKVSDNCIQDRISPHKISLVRVTFYESDGDRLSDVNVTDYISFQKCSSIHIDGQYGSNITLDLSKYCVAAREVRLENIVEVINWRKSQMSTIKLNVRRCPTGIAAIRSKTVEIIECNLDFSLLCKTLEKLSIRQCTLRPLSNESFFLPNLKSLLLYYYDGYFPIESVSDLIMSTIPRFVNCANLHKMILGGSGVQREVKRLDVNWFPKSIKVLNLHISDSFEFVGETNSIEVDALGLQGSTSDFKFTTVERVLERIKPNKVLFINYLILISSISNLNARYGETLTDFLSFLRSHEKQVERIVVNVHTHKLSPNDKVIFSKHVDKVSQSQNYYEFIGCNGKAITLREFHSYFGIVGNFD